MSLDPRLPCCFIAFGAAGLLLTNGAAAGELVFTSQPPTSATVGQPYSYVMTASYVSDDDDDDDDDDDEDDDDRKDDAGRPRFIARALPPWLRFDGNDTIYGTPGPEDVGQHRVKLRTKVRDNSADQDFTITVLASPSGSPTQGADLTASVSVSPNPVRVDAAATWNMIARNISDTDIGNVVLETVFAGDAAFRIEDVDDESCSIELRGDATAVVCRWSPLIGDMSRSAGVTGRASEAGEIVAVATASIADSSPADRNPGNDEARVVLSVTEARSGGASQELLAPGAVAVAVEDFDADGRDDLAVATGAGEPVWIFLNAGDAGDRPLVAVPIGAGDDAWSAAAIAADDLDSDGDADIVVANEDGPNQVLFNNGFAAFDTVSLDAAPGGSHDAAIADIDGDSFPDIVFANENQSAVYRNLGNREFEAESIGDGPSAAVAAADLIGGDLPELVFANPDRNAELYDRDGGSYALSAVLETGPASGVAAADFDLSGGLDLVIGRSAADLVLLSGSGESPSFSEADQFGQSPTVAVLARDFDTDGRNDVVSIGASGAHRLYANDSGVEPSFLARAEFSGKAATGAAPGLFDAGNAPDVAVAGSGVVAIFLNIGEPDASGPQLGSPALNLNGEPTMTVTIGEPYQDPGATAIDDADGDLTGEIRVDNPVDTNVIGRYSVTYEVEDSEGNLTTATRIVEVQARPPTGGGGGGAAGPVLLLLLLAGSPLVLLRKCHGPARL